MYQCSECGCKAQVIEGKVIRSCDHTAPVIAEMEAIAYGAGGMKKN